MKEAINNIAKYSKATKVQIGLNIVNNNLEILIYDNGVGFDLAKIPFGNGQLTMKKRIDDLNGTLLIVSSIGVGTTVSASIPITSISDI